VIHESIKKSLLRTWVPFFSRFGKLTPVQELAIPHILEGENVVVISPAASGKTEAVIAPLLENTLSNILEGPANELKILYVSPTRALVNDLFRRLVDPVTYTGLVLGRKTGDRPRLDKKHMPAVLLTTPESFDSMITRQPRILKTLDAVVLDEIHLLDNTPRGDQLRILLNRLRKFHDHLQFAALSATVDDKDIGKRYFEDARICYLGSTRELEYSLIEQDRMVDEVLKIARSKDFKKILVFFNARSLAELFSQEFNRPPFLDRVFVHHASLDKQRREQVERLMNDSDRGILCATSTLELGIDIGDVDCVVLYRPPFDISSLLQRIGRGNRRTNRLFALGIYTDPWEKMIFEVYFENAVQGRLFEKRYTPSLSVIPQQIYSYLYQRQRIGTTLKSIYNIMKPVYTEAYVKTAFRNLIDDNKIVEQRPGIYYDSCELEDKIRWGKIHSNIADSNFGEYDVFNADSQKQIGRIFHLKQRFILGGCCWETVRIADKEKRVYARYIGASPAVSKIFEGKGDGNYSYTIAPVIKQRILPDLAILEFPMALDRGNTYILHLFGHLYGFIIADALFEQSMDALDAEGKMLVMNNYEHAESGFPMPEPDAINKVIRRNIARLEDALGSGAYLYDLPLDMQVKDHYLNLDIDGFLDFLSSIKLVLIDLKKFQKTINALKDQ
jgi:ATP-dependent Lhr-like helicase